MTYCGSTTFVAVNDTDTEFPEIVRLFIDNNLNAKRPTKIVLT